MSMALWEYFWTEADWVPPEGQIPQATRYVYRHRVNYIIRAAIVWARSLLSPRPTAVALEDSS